MTVFSLDENQARYQIRGFQPGTLQVNEITYTKSLIIAPDNLITDWEPQQISELRAHHLTEILRLHPAIFLLGTGTTLEFPTIEYYGDLINAGIGVEIMDTRAACRTFNALAAEDRNVIAALIIR